MYEGWYLIFNRRSKRLSFRKASMDDRTHLTVGQVRGGVVNRQSVTYWVGKIEQQRKMPCHG